MSEQGFIKRIGNHIRCGNVAVSKFVTAGPNLNAVGGGGFVVHDDVRRVSTTFKRPHGAAVLWHMLNKKYLRDEAMVVHYGRGGAN